MTETEHPDLFRVVCHHAPLLKRGSGDRDLAVSEKCEVYVRRVNIERRVLAGHRQAWDLRDETKVKHGLDRLGVHRLVCLAPGCGYDLPLPMDYLDALASACCSNLTEATVFVLPPGLTEEQAMRSRKGANIRRVFYPEDSTGGTIVEIEISIIP